MAIVVTALGTAQAKGGDALTLNVAEGAISIGDTIIACGAKVAYGVTAKMNYPRFYYDGVNDEGIDTEDVYAENTDNVGAVLWRAVVSNASSAGAFIRVSSNVNPLVRAFTAYKVTGLATTPLDKTATGTGNSTDANTGTTATLSQADELVIGFSAVNDEIDDPHGTWTTGAGYVSGNEQFAATNGGGDSSNVQAHSVAEIVSATTAQTGIDAGHHSTNWAALIATYKGVVEGNVTVTPGVIAQSLAEYIPVLGLKIVGASPTAQTLTNFNAVTGFGYVPSTASIATTKYAPVLREVLTPTTLSLVTTKYVSILKETTTPSTLSLTTTGYVSSIIFGTVVIPTTISLSLTEYISILKEVTTPTTLNLSDTQYVPILKEVTTPTTLNLSDTEYIPILKEVTTPGTLSLILTFYVPDVTEPVAILVTPATLSLLLTGYIPVPAPGFGFYVGTINREPLWVSGPPKDIIFTDVEEEITFE